jgi:hypothetical protein
MCSLNQLNDGWLEYKAAASRGCKGQLTVTFHDSMRRRRKIQIAALIGIITDADWPIAEQDHKVA